MALEFDNGSDTDLYAENATELDTLDKVSASAWIYPVGWGQDSYGQIVSKDAASTGWYFFLSNVGSTDGVATIVFYRFRDTTDTYVIGSDNAITLNQWQHVAVTHKTDATRLYVNSVLLTPIYNEPGAGAFTSDTGADFNIGNRYDLARDFDGDIEDVRVYDDRLNPDAVAALSTCRGHDGYKFNIVWRGMLAEKAAGVNISTDDVPDISGYGNDATPYVTTTPYKGGVISKRRRV